MTVAETPDVIRVSGTFTQQDFIDGMGKTPELERLTSPLILLLLGGLPTAVAVVIGGWKLVHFGLLPVLVILAVRFWAVPAQAKRAFTAMANREVEYVFRQESVEINSGSSQARLAYQDAVRFVNSPTTFLIYVAPRVMQIIPKRLFGDSELALVEQWLSQIKTRDGAKNRYVLKLVLWVVVIALLLVIHLLLTPATH